MKSTPLITSLCAVSMGMAILIFSLRAQEQDNPAVQSLPEVEYMGMKLHAQWMPKMGTAAMKKTLEYTKDFLRFSCAAVEGKARDHDTKPVTIVGPLTWLMPVMEAAKKLAQVGVKPELTGMVEIKTVNWPQSSLFVRTYTGDITDPNTGEIFKHVYLISDRKGQLVSVQFNNNHPKTPVRFESVPDGRKEPYYGFLTMQQNSSSGQQVWYQNKTYKNTGVTCIHTILIRPTWPLGQVMENVRWYLPAPLARILLEIAEKEQLGAVPAK